MTTGSSIEDRLDRILGRYFRLPLEQSLEGLSADQVEGWDSLAHVGLILEVEKEFGILFGGLGAEGFTSRSRLLKAITEALVAPLTTFQVSTDAAQGVEPQAPIIVFGDSQVRAFAYMAGFLPILLLRGQHLNTLTAENTETTRQALAWMMARLPCDARLIFIGCGTVLHHLSDTFSTRSAVADAQSPAFLAHQAKQMVMLLQEAVADRPLLILTTPLNRDPDGCFFANAYNDALLPAAAAAGIATLDMNRYLVGSNGLARADAMLDPWHLSSAFVRQLRPDLTALGFAHSGETPMQRRYTYRRETGFGTVTIWGEAPESALRFPTGEEEFGYPNAPMLFVSRPSWETMQPRTDRMVEMVAALDRYAGILLPDNSPWSTVVVDCVEGLIPMLLPADRFQPVLGRDAAGWRIADARLLAGLYDRSDLLFCVAAVADPLPACDVAILFEREFSTGEFLALIAGRARNNCRLLAVATHSPVATANLLHRCGYGLAVPIPVGPLHAMTGPPHRHPMVQGLGTTVLHLVLAMPALPEAEIVAHFQATVAANISRQSAWIQRAFTAYSDLFTLNGG